MNFELRMYGLVPYNISPIQCGIQYGHAVIEYGLLFFNDKDYQNWAKNHKTFIILNGGTSNHSINRYHEGEFVGSMELHLKTLQENKIKVASFFEPNLNDMLSGICFLVDERVFNIIKYPDFVFGNYQSTIFNPECSSISEEKAWAEWIESIGGDRNLFLRKFLRGFKLA